MQHIPWSLSAHKHGQQAKKQFLAHGLAGSLAQCHTMRHQQVCLQHPVHLCQAQSARLLARKLGNQERKGERGRGRLGGGGGQCEGGCAALIHPACMYASGHAFVEQELRLASDTITSSVSQSGKTQSTALSRLVSSQPTELLIASIISQGSLAQQGQDLTAVCVCSC